MTTIQVHGSIFFTPSHQQCSNSSSTALQLFFCRRHEDEVKVAFTESVELCTVADFLPRTYGIYLPPSQAWTCRQWRVSRGGAPCTAFCTSNFQTGGPDVNPKTLFCAPTFGDASSYFSERYPTHYRLLSGASIRCINNKTAFFWGQHPPGSPLVKRDSMQRRQHLSKGGLHLKT